MNRFFRRTYGVVLSVIVAIAVGCSGSDPIAPSASSPSHSTSRSQSPNRAVISVGQIMISADRTSVEMIPARTADLHLNVVKLLEGKACDDCLKLGDFFITSNDRLIIELTLTHPYHGMLKFSGFDVRAIVITPCDYNFPVAGRSVNRTGSVRLLFPDGYTNLYNPTEYPETLPGPPALRYIPGRFSTGDELTATLNPFIAFKKENERRLFETNIPETKTLSLQLVPGQVEFGYAVDACWTPIDETEIDPLEDFPLTANCREAYAIFGRQGAGLKPLTGTGAPYQVEVWDHQGVETISVVSIEAPDLFNGAVTLSRSDPTENGMLFEGTVVNEKGATAGDYPLLIRVIDWDEDENLGQIDAWQVATVKVTEIGYPINQLIYIPAGEFFMGVDPENDPYEPCRASPGHMHPTDAYYIGKYEVTNIEFESFIAAGGYDNPDWWSDYGWEWKTTYGITEPFNWDAYLTGIYYPDAGVIVRYPEAEAFCAWAGGRLPTEAEWERASRGDTDHRLFPWGDEWNPEYLSWRDNPLIENLRKGFHWPVGLFPDGNSPWGLADCAGNSPELCSEWWMGTELYEQYAAGDYTPPLQPDPGAEIWRKTRRTDASDIAEPGDFRCAWRHRTADIKTSQSTCYGFRTAFDAG